MLKNAFLYRAALHESKKRLYREAKNFISRKLYELHSKPLSYAQKLLLYVPFFAVRKNSHFHKPKAILLHKPFLILTKSNPFPPSTFHSYTLNLLSAKNKTVLLLFALILCCKAGASHRFKSLPAIPDEVAAFRKTGYLMNAGHFRKNTVSTGDLNRPRSPEVRKPLVCFLVTFCTTQKVTTRTPSQEAPRFRKPRISAPQPQLRAATIKTFLRKFRDFANLESAHYITLTH